MWKNSKKEWRYKFLPKNPGEKIQKILPNTTSLCTSQWHCTPFNLFPFLHYKYSSPYYIMLIYFFSTGLLIRYWVLDKNRLFFLYAVSIDLLLFAPASIKYTYLSIHLNGNISEHKTNNFKSVTITVSPAMIVKSNKNSRVRKNICFKGM